jgi:hypothetical protein
MRAAWNPAFDKMPVGTLRGKADNPPYHFRLGGFGRAFMTHVSPATLTHQMNRSLIIPSIAQIDARNGMKRHDVQPACDVITALYTWR